MEPHQPLGSRNFDFFSAKKILVANDFSLGAVSALVAGLRLAHRIGSELIILNVEEGTLCIPAGKKACEHLVEQESHHEETRKRIRRMLDNHLVPLVRLNLPAVRLVAVDGDPATEIVKAAFDHQVELILIASHARPADCEKTLLGETVGKVVKYASCSVLVVRPHKGELDLPPVKSSGELVA